MLNRNSMDHSQPMSAGVNTMLRALDTVPHHPKLEQMVDIICNKTSNNDRPFFRTVTAYFFAKIAANMRANLKTLDRGEIPVNVYTVALAPSGYGKGHSISILEKQFLAAFKKRFLDETFPLISEKKLYDLACDRALINSTDPDEEKEKIEKEYRKKGAYTFTFDSGTREGVRQIREKLLMSGIGSINYQVDEIGSNLINNSDILTLFFELYDQGEIKTKLIKSSSDNERGEELEGRTPTNALLFGTPATLFDGHLVEAQFQAFLEAGYARRCIFAWGDRPSIAERVQISARDKFLHKTQPQNHATVQTFAQHFALLADPRRFAWEIEVPEDIGIELTTYEEICIARAAEFSTHEEVRRSEMEHRYFKTLKLAGALAFVDESDEVTMDHLYHAIKLVEESGNAFDNMLRREKNFVRLAKYIAEKGGELTHPEIQEALPFYKDGAAKRNELMSLARDWGYRNHIIIRKIFRDEGVEIFTGETLQKTDLTKMTLSWSDHVAYNYNGEQAPFEELQQLVQASGLHWCNHAFTDQHRTEEKAIPGFNMVVIDVDGGMPLHTAQELMQDHMFLTYTTKRHSEEQNRFRMVIPTNYVLKLDTEDYKAFMDNVMGWLPFSSDESANQRSKKWETFAGGEFFLNTTGKPLDVLPFLPRTTKNEAYKKSMEGLQSLDNLERWFAQRIVNGNRNNQFIKYALALVDAGLTYTQVEEAVISFNHRLPNSMTEDELRSTILLTVAKKVHGKP